VTRVNRARLCLRHRAVKSTRRSGVTGLTSQCRPFQRQYSQPFLQFAWQSQGLLSNINIIQPRTTKSIQPYKTRSQAVARRADRTASQHLWGHVTSSVTWPFDSPYAISYWWSFGTKPLSLTVSETFNVKCNAMVGVTLIRPLNKDQGHSFWYQSISHIRLPRLSNSNFCSRTHRLATIHNVTDRQTTDGRKPVA